MKQYKQGTIRLSLVIAKLEINSGKEKEKLNMKATTL
jgi:hypothetical protein